VSGPRACRQLAGEDFARLDPEALARAVLAADRARPAPPAASLDAAFWTERYRQGGDRWDLGRAAPPLARWFADHPPAPGTRAIVVGCGRGHEAFPLAAAGATVTIGPPFSTSSAELRARFAPHLSCAVVEIPPDSVASRRGEELLTVWRRPAGR